MDLSKIYNGFRALDLRETDNTPTIKGDARETIVTSLVDSVTTDEGWPTEQADQRVSLILDLLTRNKPTTTPSTMTEIPVREVTDDNRDRLVTKLVTLI